MGRNTDMSVASNLKLTRAYKFMPAEERTETRDLVLVNGDLYFGGDKAWFKVENFMKSNVDFRMRVDDMRTVLSMKGEVEAIAEDQYSVRFTNGKQSMIFHCHLNGITVPATISVLPDTSYIDKPDLFKRSKGIDGLIDENCTAGITTFKDQAGDDHGYLIIFKDSALAIIEGEPGMDIDLTSSPEILSELVNEQTKVFIDKKIIHSMTDTDDYKIYTSVQHASNRFPEKIKSFTHNIAQGSLEKDDALEPISEIEVNVIDFMEALQPVTKMKHEGYITIESDIDKLQLSVTDTTKNIYNTEIDCVSKDRIKFESVMITPAMLNFLMGAVKTTPDKAVMKLSVNPWKMRMILRMTPNDDNVNALCMMKVII